MVGLTKQHIRAISVLVTLNFCCIVSAAEVFHWIDENGVMHFSQWAPDDVSDVSKLVVNAKNPPGYDPLEDPYSIRNQAERTNATWKELEARKEERREKFREERERSVPYSPAPYDAYYSYVRPLPYWPVHRPVYSRIHRPIHLPIHPPGHRPTPLPIHPVAPVQFSPDPMRSAHIGVRRSPAPNSSVRIE